MPVDPKLKVVATHLHDYKSKVYIVYIFEAKDFKGDLKSSSEGETLWINYAELLDNEKLYPDLKRHLRLVSENPDGDTLFTYHRFNKNLKIIEER